MDKELIQEVIDNLMLSNPKRKEFEADLRELLEKHKKAIRLTCENQFEKLDDERLNDDLI